MVTRTLLSLAVALVFIPTLFAVAPPNDKVAKAIKLTGTDGNVNATNVDATKELTEPTNGGAEATVWYSFTAPTEGFLVFSYDPSNNMGNSVLARIYDVFPGRFAFFRRFHGIAGDGFDGTRETLIIPFPRGFTHQIQFDSSPLGQTGAFTFSYKFVPSAIRVENPSQAEGIFARESDAALKVTLARIGSTEGVGTVDYSFSGFGDDAALDFTTANDPFTGTVTFQPGESRHELSFAIIHDPDVETNEIFLLELSDPSTGLVVLKGTTFLYVEDDDNKPSNDDFADAMMLTGTDITQLTPAGSATTEPGNPAYHGANVWFKWTAPSTGLMQISNDAFLGTAVFTGTTLANLVQQRPADIYSPAVQAVYTDGAYPVVANATYYISVVGYDSVANGTTNFHLKFDNVVPGAPTTGPAIFSLSRDTYETLEGSPTVKVKIKRRGSDATLASSVTIKTLSAADAASAGLGDYTPDAEEGVDYVVKDELVTFAAGETEKEVQITINPDTKKEGAEHFFVQLVQASALMPLEYAEFAVVRINPGKALPSYGMFKSTYSGVLKPVSGPGGEGFITIKLTATGKFTGSLLLDGQKIPLMGTLPPLPSSPEPNDDTTTTLHITRANMATLDVELRYHFDLSNSPSIVCTIGDGTTTTASTTATPAFFFKYYPLPVLGTFTVALTPDTGIPMAVRQPAFLSLEVKSKGTLKVIGALPDATVFSGSGFIGFQLDANFRPRFDANFVVPLYKGTGSLGGSLHLTDPTDQFPAPPAGDGFGTLRWLHPSVVGPVSAPFSGAFDAFVSRYTVPKGALILGAPGDPLVLNLTGGGVNPAINAVGTLGAKNAVTFAPGTTGTPTVKFSAKTGLFGGKFTPAGATKPVPFAGAVTRNRQIGTGFFLNGGDAGKVVIGLH